MQGERDCQGSVLIKTSPSIASDGASSKTQQLQRLQLATRNEEGMKDRSAWGSSGVGEVRCAATRMTSWRWWCSGSNSHQRKELKKLSRRWRWLSSWWCWWAGGRLCLKEMLLTWTEENRVLLLVSDHDEQGWWYGHQKESRGRWEGEKVDAADERFSLSWSWEWWWFG